MSLLAEITCSDNLTGAYHWLCDRRKHYPPNADIWHLRHHKQRELAKLTEELRTNRYTIMPLTLVTKANGERIALWSARDALVIKMLTQVLATILPVHAKCEHVAGHRGGKRSLRHVDEQMRSGRYQFVCRTDIKGYYANINKHQLLEQMTQYVTCKTSLNLIGQYLFYSVEDGGEFYTPKQGISRGSPLSPLLAGFQLYCIDKYFANLMDSRQQTMKTTGQKCKDSCVNGLSQLPDGDIYYARYMDDFIIFTRTRWQLRRAVKRLNQFFNQFGFKQHPDKTYIGRIGTSKVENRNELGRNEGKSCAQVTSATPDAHRGVTAEPASDRLSERSKKVSRRIKTAGDKQEGTQATILRQLGRRETLNQTENEGTPLLHSKHTRQRKKSPISVGDMYKAADMCKRKCFDWMGLMFNLSGALGPAPRAIENHLSKCRQLYGEAQRRGWDPSRTQARLDAYRRRWNAAIDCISLTHSQHTSARTCPFNRQRTHHVDRGID
ncbi:reverse transcriptase domain-containing protein [Shewanella violacea]|uniref:Reverse transcriptase domain-containing protein n=1 Tax=Shewanella violacea (strain JCM 10179 / CIP 106290 / LMG 19151 / DSS12) TaxID=637905 RepID=D4ZMB3_SHEVD|nr:reverse transcriptase domain-containing protein [Shewanella violacea]BAJ02812.1 hypothetical protein SVI_2841 [Shewanella violacea DSS12]